MDGLLNIDLLWVGIAVAGAGTLGASIYFSDPKSATARAFGFFCIASICWSIANFASARVTDPAVVLLLIRLVLFFAVWHAFSFFMLASQFPSTSPVVTPRFFLALLSWTTVVSIVVLTPVVYESITAIQPVVQTQTGPGLPLFGLTALAFIGGGLWKLWMRFRKTTGSEHQQMESVFAGVALTFVFVFVFDFIFPAFFNNPALVPYGGLFLLPFIFGTAYAIMRYRLFSIRVAIFGVLTFILATATFFDILFSASLGVVFYRLGELALVLVSGVWLVKSMVREFELERELEETNERQEGLLRFMSHEVKGFLTKDEGAFAAILDGDFGSCSPELVPFVERALSQTRDGVNSVMDILKASNQKQGKIEYKKEKFDLKKVVGEVVEKEKPIAAAKKLELSFTAPEGNYDCIGDQGEIGTHVVRNLIENSINYTPSGKIEVHLENHNGDLVFSVKDTGIGISLEDKKKLFTEGGHGRDSQKINVHSTGYGLYIAKNIVTAHGGTIRAESEGPGKGAMFVVDLPAAP